MDGRGRVFDNIFVERLWRTVKYEEDLPETVSDGSRSSERLSQVLSLLQYRRESMKPLIIEPLMNFMSKIG